MGKDTPCSAGAERISHVGLLPRKRSHETRQGDPAGRGRSIDRRSPARSYTHPLAELTGVNKYCGGEGGRRTMGRICIRAGAVLVVLGTVLLVGGVAGAMDRVQVTPDGTA